MTPGSEGKLEFTPWQGTTKTTGPTGETKGARFVQPAQSRFGQLGTARQVSEHKLNQIIQEELTKMLNEAKFKVGDKVKHDSDDLGVGKVVAVESGKKGNIVVRWKSGTRKHHRWALKPAD